LVVKTLSAGLFVAAQYLLSSPNIFVTSSEAGNLLFADGGKQQIPPRLRSSE
jgi:hypothetical protein